MRILIATEVIHPGGAETFLLRLAQSLQDKGHEVVVFNFRDDIFHKALQHKIAPGVKVVCAANPRPLLTRVTDGIAGKIRLDLSVRNRYIRQSLRKLLAEFRPDIIHSHLFKTDLVCCEVAKEYNIPVVSTMHGDYTMYYNAMLEGKPAPLQFERKLKEVLHALKCIVCISDEQVRFFHEKMQQLIDRPLHIEKVYNGYEAARTAHEPLNRQTLNIPETAFVYGMVARGIPSKGWEELIAAFRMLADDHARLLLVGGSEYMDELKKQYSDEPRIIFAGTVTNPLEWIRLFDTGLLPSYFGSESLPTVVMEYLYCGKPVIATRIGEVPLMISHEGQNAGLLVDIVNGKTDVTQLHAAMERMHHDQTLYTTLKAATPRCFEQFDMDRCLSSYEHIYRQYTS